jgi:hypothetical protein
MGHYGMFSKFAHNFSKIVDHSSFELYQKMEELME